MNTVNNGIEMVFERKIMNYSGSDKVGDIEIYNNEFYRLQISYMEDNRTFSLNQHYP